jgi:hypothetical protein
MNKILDRLYLGDLEDAGHLTRLQSCNVTHILQVAAGFKPQHPKQFTYKIINVLDAPFVNIARHFQSAI